MTIFEKPKSSAEEIKEKFEKYGDLVKSISEGDVLVSQSGTRRKVNGITFLGEQEGGGLFAFTTKKNGKEFSEAKTFKEISLGAQAIDHLEKLVPKPESFRNFEYFLDNFHAYFKVGDVLVSHIGTREKIIATHINLQNIDTSYIEIETISEEGKGVHQNIDLHKLFSNLLLFKRIERTFR